MDDTVSRCKMKKIDEGIYAHERFAVPTPSHRRSLKFMAESFFEVARNILKRDGHHAYFAILVSRLGAQPLTLHIKNSEDKQRIMARVAKEAEDLNADVVMLISEVWYADFDPHFPDRPASEAPVKTEMLFLSAISKSGEAVYLSATFEKRDGKVWIGETKQMDASRIASPVFDPLRKMWIWKDRQN